MYLCIFTVYKVTFRVSGCFRPFPSYSRKKVLRNFSKIVKVFLAKLFVGIEFLVEIFLLYFRQFPVGFCNKFSFRGGQWPSGEVGCG